MKNFKGFTLTEILAVVAIIAILAAAAIPVFSGIVKSSANKSNNATANTIAECVELFKDDAYNYRTELKNPMVAVNPDELLVKYNKLYELDQLNDTFDLFAENGVSSLTISESMPDLVKDILKVYSTKKDFTPRGEAGKAFWYSCKLGVAVVADSDATYSELNTRFSNKLSTSSENVGLWVKI